MTISKDDKLALSMGVLCFQGFGIRIFAGIDGAIAIWLFVLIFLNWKYIKHVPNSYWIKIVTIAVGYVLFSLIKGVSVRSFIIIAWLSAAVVLTPYYLRQADFVQVMRRFTRFCMYYCLCHVPIMLFLKGALITTPFPMHPKTFLYLFYFNGDSGGLFGLPRIQGFCWEPSCWNLLLDFNLVFTLYYKEKRSIVIASIFAIVAIMSTTGLVVMAVIVFLYYLMNLKRKNFVSTCIALTAFALIVGPIVYGDFTGKLSSGSGNARIGDLAVAVAVMREHPLLGIDKEGLTSNLLVIKAREAAWNVDGDKVGYMEQGMCNAFAALIVEWGIPIFLLIIYTMLQTPLLPNVKLKVLYLGAMVCVLMGTPIAATGFFYMYALSAILLNSQKMKSHFIKK